MSRLQNSTIEKATEFALKNGGEMISMFNTIR